MPLSSTTNPDDEILAKVMRELESMKDTGPLVEKYVSEYPHLADRIREIPAMLKMGQVLEDVNRA